MRLLLYFLIALFLSSCESGGGGNQEKSPSKEIMIYGRVIDGYVSGASVFVDLNLNNALDVDEPNTKTNDQGYYELMLNSVPLDNEIEIVAQNGQDIMFKEPLQGILKATKQVQSYDSVVEINISPLSTLSTTYRKHKEYNISIEEATSYINAFAQTFNLKEDSVAKFHSEPNDLKQNIKLHRLILSLTKLEYKSLENKNIYNVYENFFNYIKDEKLNDIKTIHYADKTINAEKLTQAIYQKAEDLTNPTSLRNTKIFEDTTQNPEKYIQDQPNSSTENPAQTQPINPITPPPSPPTNTAPVAYDINISLAEDTSITADLNATDAQSDTLTFAKVTDPSSGGLSINATTGAFTYQPGLNYCGTDSFTYKANDGKADSNEAKVTITIFCINDKPTAKDFNITNITNQQTTINWQTKAQAFDAEDGANLTAESNSTQSPTKGSITISGKNLTYAPSPNQTGTDTFKLNIKDQNNSFATITIQAQDIDTKAPQLLGSSNPQDNATSFSIDSNLTLKFDKSIKFDSVTLKKDAIEITTTHKLTDTNKTLNIKPTNTLEYGTNYTLTLTNLKDDINNTQAVKTINFKTSLDPNTAPVAHDVNISLDEDTNITANLNATDAQSDTLTYTKLTDPTNGVISDFNKTTGAFTYTPSANFNGTDSFTYKANDGKLDSNQAKINIKVNSVNDDFSVTEMTNLAKLSFKKQTFEGFSGFYKTTSSLTADFDNDGKDEVLLLSYNKHKILYYKYDESSKKLVKKGTTAIDGVPMKGSVVDLNNDGKLDFLATAIKDDKPHYLYFENKGSGDFPFEMKVISERTYKGYYTYIEAANLDDDENLEVIGISFNWDNRNKHLAIFDFDGTSFTQKYTLENDQNGQHFCVMDVNNDGHQDIIVGHSSKLSWYKNKGEATLSSNSFEFQTTPLLQNTIGNGISLIECKDIDNDGKKDILLSKPISIEVFKNNGDATFTKISFYRKEADNGQIGTNAIFSDINNDGQKDIIFMDFNKLSYTLNENGNFALDNQDKRIAIANFPSLIGHATLSQGDINGDGLTDIIFTPFEEGDTQPQYFIQTPKIFLKQAEFSTKDITKLTITDIDNDVQISLTPNTNTTITRSRTGTTTTATLKFASQPDLGEHNITITIKDSGKTITKPLTIVVYTPQALSLTAANPANNESEFSADTLSYTFNQPLDLTNATISLKKGATDIPTTYTLTNQTLTISPTENLDPLESYQLKITGIKDIAGTSLHDQSISFTTRAKIYFVQPTATGSSDGSSWDNANSIQNAITAVSSELDKDKYQIWLKAGTYQGSTITLDSGVKIYGGFSGTETKLSQRNFLTNKTIFHGQNTRRAFIANSKNNIIIDGIIVQNANSGNNNGAGMSLDSSTITIKNTIFQNNKTTNNAFGAGIYLGTGSELKIYNSSFKNNEAQDGSAIVSYSKLEIYDSNFTENKNRAGSGGAIYSSTADLIIKTSNFTKNEAPEQYGGAIYINGTGKTALIEDSNFTENKALQNGGAIYNNKGTLTIKNSNFTQNKTPGNRQNGGAVYAHTANTTIKNSNFTENNASGADGKAGAVYMILGTALIEDSNFTKNEAIGFGGAISSQKTKINIKNSSFSNNKASDGSGIFPQFGKLEVYDSNFTQNQNALGSGGAIYDYQTDSIIIKTSNFTKNEAPSQHGGAIYIKGIEGKTALIEDSNFTENKAKQGGAILDKLGTLTIKNSNFIKNKATNAGGAIRLEQAKATISDSNFTKNESKEDIGGAIHASTTDTTIKNSNFTQNEAKKHGGAIYIVGNDKTTSIEDSNFTQNEANNQGGAIYNLKGILTTKNSNFIKNKAKTNAGGAIKLEQAKATISDSSFSNNESHIGGALHTYLSDQNITNSTFSQNKSYNGGAIYSKNTKSINVINSTFVDNKATRQGQAIYDNNNIPKIINSIFWNTTAPTVDDIKGVQAQNITKSIIQTTSLTNTTNILQSNPQLTAHTENEVVKYYTPAQTSPAKDAGVSTLSGITIPTTDQLGNSRDDATPDIGSIEIN